MTRLGILLSAILIVCALGLVASQHRARSLFVELGRAEAKTRQIEGHWSQLQLEQTALATAARIDARAKANLAMQPVTPQRTLHLNVGPRPEQTAMGSAR
ncbi:MAG: cell division protein FtsL [Burkholderiales bacterium]|nr:cell division protein FtsL [Burkholderiales bacterium]